MTKTIAILCVFIFSVSTIGHAKADKQKAAHSKSSKEGGADDKALEKKFKTLPKMEIEIADRGILVKIFSNNKVDVERLGTGDKLESGTWDVKKSFLLINYGRGKEAVRIRYLVQIKKDKILINQRADDDGVWKVNSKPQAVQDNQIIKDVNAVGEIQDIEVKNKEKVKIDHSAPDLEGIDSEESH